MFMFRMTANWRMLDNPAAMNWPPTATIPTTPDNWPGEVNNAGKAERNWDVMFTNWTNGRMEIAYKENPVVIMFKTARQIMVRIIFAAGPPKAKIICL